MGRKVYYDKKAGEWAVVSNDGKSAAWGGTKELAIERFEEMMKRLEETENEH